MHAGGHMLDRQLDPVSGDVARRAMSDLGIDLITGVTVHGLLLDGVGAVRGVELSDRSRLDADLVLVAAGVAPRVELAGTAGSASTGASSSMRTSDALTTPGSPRSAIAPSRLRAAPGCWHRAGSRPSSWPHRWARSCTAPRRRSGSPPQRPATWCA